MGAYTVQSGDSAASLYDRSYGDYSAWVKNVGRLTPGQVIYLPDTQTIGQAPRVGTQETEPAPTVHAPAPFTPAIEGTTIPTAPAIGTAFPRDQATLTPQGVIYAGQAALWQPPSVNVPATITPSGTAPNIGGLFAPPQPAAVLGQAFPRNQATLTPQGAVYAGQAAMRTLTPVELQQITGGRGNIAYQTYGEQAREAAGANTRVIGGVTYTLSVDAAGNRLWRAAGSTGPPSYKNQLEYLDALRATDPERAAEVARFQAATIGRSSPESALATNVFFTEKAIFEQGILARNASENVWDVIAQRLGTGQTGAELLTQLGYVPIGGGLWYLGRLGAGGGSNITAASPRNLGTGGGFENGDSGSRFLRNASIGLFNWRISA